AVNGNFARANLDVAVDLGIGRAPADMDRASEIAGRAIELRHDADEQSEIDRLELGVDVEPWIAVETRRLAVKGERSAEAFRRGERDLARLDLGRAGLHREAARRGLQCGPASA